MIDGVSGVDWITFESHGDARGSLVAIESNQNIAFEIKRVYYIYDTLPEVVRGKHAHRNMNQILICLNGQCDIALYDGHKKTCAHLDTPETGIYITGYIWREMYHFSKDCVLLAITDKAYHETEYIYDENLVGKSV